MAAAALIGCEGKETVQENAKPAKESAGISEDSEKPAKRLSTENQSKFEPGTFLGVLGEARHFLMMMDNAAGYKVTTPENTIEHGFGPFRIESDKLYVGPFSQLTPNGVPTNESDEIFFIIKNDNRLSLETDEGTVYLDRM
jgi:hypothetical protein